MRPRVVAIGGLDPSGRAGVLVDAAALRAAGAEALAIVTCIAAQGARPLVEPVSMRALEAQLEAAGRVDAAKLGVVFDRAQLAVIARWLGDTPAVVDPVTVSSKGVKLSSLTAADYRRLARKSVVLTPNRDELGALQPLRGFGAIVVKSFAPGTDAILLDGKRPILLGGKPLRRSPAHRGTGCRFASVLAVALAKGHTVTHATRAAKRAVRKFLSTPILRAQPCA